MAFHFFYKIHSRRYNKNPAHKQLRRTHPPSCISQYPSILPVFLYGCETWSLTLGEERKLRVFVNMVLRRIFGPRRDKVTGEWRRLYNEELNDLYFSPYIVRVIKSRRMSWAGHVTRMGEKRGCIGSWWGNRREGDHWEDPDIDGWIILGRISKR